MSFTDIIKSFDFAVLGFIQENIRCAFLDGIMAFFSYMGEIGAVWLAASVVLLFFKTTRKTGVMMIVAMALGFLIGELGLKNIVCRPRPFVVNSEIVPNVSPPSSYSFPSGHSCSSFAGATVIFAHYKKAGVSALALAVIIAFSRLYNGVHFPSDVICGALLGVICALIVIYAFKRLEAEKILSNEQVKRYNI